MSAIPSGGVGSTQIFWLLPGQFTLPTEFMSLEGEKTLVPLEGVSGDVALSLKRQKSGSVRT